MSAKRRPLRTEMSNWEAIELYQRYRSGEPIGTLQLSYNMSYVTVRKIIDAVESAARSMGLVV